MEANTIKQEPEEYLAAPQHPQHLHQDPPPVTVKSEPVWTSEADNVTMTSSSSCLSVMTPSAHLQQSASTFPVGQSSVASTSQSQSLPALTTSVPVLSAAASSAPVPPDQISKRPLNFKLQISQGGRLRLAPLACLGSQPVSELAESGQRGNSDGQLFFVKTTASGDPQLHMAFTSQPTKLYLLQPTAGHQLNVKVNSPVKPGTGMVAVGRAPENAKVSSPMTPGEVMAARGSRDRENVKVTLPVKYGRRLVVAMKPGASKAPDLTTPAAVSRSRSLLKGAGAQSLLREGKPHDTMNADRDTLKGTIKCSKGNVDGKSAESGVGLSKDRQTVMVTRASVQEHLNRTEPSKPRTRRSKRATSSKRGYTVPTEHCSWTDKPKATSLLTGAMWKCRQSMQDEVDASNIEQATQPEEEGCSGTVGNQDDDSSNFPFKIDSVFSLAAINEQMPDFLEEEEERDSYLEKAIKVEFFQTHRFTREEMLDMCGSSFVVLERLIDKDIDEKGHVRVQSRCSEYCRKRTLNYLCMLDLIRCHATKKKRVKLEENDSSSAPNLTQETGSCAEVPDSDTSAAASSSGLVAQSDIKQEVYSLPGQSQPADMAMDSSSSSQQAVAVPQSTGNYTITSGSVRPTTVPSAPSLFSPITATPHSSDEILPLKSICPLSTATVSAVPTASLTSKEMPLPCASPTPSSLLSSPLAGSGEPKVIVAEIRSKSISVEEKLAAEKGDSNASRNLTTERESPDKQGETASVMESQGRKWEITLVKKSQTAVAGLPSEKDILQQETKALSEDVSAVGTISKNQDQGAPERTDSLGDVSAVSVATEHTPHPTLTASHDVQSSQGLQTVAPVILSADASGLTTTTKPISIIVQPTACTPAAGTKEYVSLLTARGRMVSKPVSVGDGSALLASGTSMHSADQGLPAVVSPDATSLLSTPASTSSVMMLDGTTLAPSLTTGACSQTALTSLVSTRATRLSAPTPLLTAASSVGQNTTAVSSLPTVGGGQVGLLALVPGAQSSVSGPCILLLGNGNALASTTATAGAPTSGLVSVLPVVTAANSSQGQVSPALSASSLVAGKLQSAQGTSVASSVSSLTIPISSLPAPSYSVVTLGSCLTPTSVHQACSTVATPLCNTGPQTVQSSTSVTLAGKNKNTANTSDTPTTPLQTESGINELLAKLVRCGRPTVMATSKTGVVATPSSQKDVQEPRSHVRLVHIAGGSAGRSVPCNVLSVTASSAASVPVSAKGRPPIPHVIVTSSSHPTPRVIMSTSQPTPRVIMTSPSSTRVILTSPPTHRVMTTSASTPRVILSSSLPSTPRVIMTSQPTPRVIMASQPTPRVIMSSPLPPSSGQPSTTPGPFHRITLPPSLSSTAQKGSLVSVVNKLTSSSSVSPTLTTAPRYVSSRFQTPSATGVSTAPSTSVQPLPASTRMPLLSSALKVAGGKAPGQVTVIIRPPLSTGGVYTPPTTVSALRTAGINNNNTWTTSSTTNQPFLKIILPAGASAAGKPVYVQSPAVPVLPSCTKSPPTSLSKTVAAIEVNTQSAGNALVASSRTPVASSLTVPVTSADTRSELRVLSTAHSPPSSLPSGRGATRTTSDVTTVDAVSASKRAKASSTDDTCAQSKRARLEKRYPLPPGVVIKTEPQTFGYPTDMDSSTAERYPDDDGPSCDYQAPALVSDTLLDTLIASSATSQASRLGGRRSRMSISETPTTHCAETSTLDEEATGGDPMVDFDSADPPVSFQLIDPTSDSDEAELATQELECPHLEASVCERQAAVYDEPPVLTPEYPHQERSSSRDGGASEYPPIAHPSSSRAAGGKDRRASSPSVSRPPPPPPRRTKGKGKKPHTPSSLSAVRSTKSRGQPATQSSHRSRQESTRVQEACSDPAELVSDSDTDMTSSFGSTSHSSAASLSPSPRPSTSSEGQGSASLSSSDRIRQLKEMLIKQNEQLDRIRRQRASQPAFTFPMDD